jgi:hypothetical protein
MGLTSAEDQKLDFFLMFSKYYFYKSCVNLVSPLCSEVMPVIDFTKALSMCVICC